MPIQPFGQADPIYDALRVQSNQATWPDAGGGSGSTGGAGLENKIYLWPADGSTISTYDATEAGLIAALAAAAGISGSTVWQPSIPITITTSITIPADTTLRGMSQGSILNLAGSIAGGGGGGSFPTTSILDNFNRADEGPPPSANWGSFHSSWAFPDELSVSSNQAYALISEGANFWNVNSFGPDCEVYCTVSDVPAFAAQTVIFLRVVGETTDLTTTGSYYSLLINSGASTVHQIIRFTGGSSSILASGTNTITLATGDKIGLSRVGNTLTAYHKPAAGAWTAFDTVVDGSPLSAVAGRIALESSTYVDDFGGGTVAASLTPVSLILAAGASLERILVNQTDNTATDIVAVQGPATGTANIVQASITSTQSGAGDAAALASGAGNVYAHDTYFNGNSASGAGYGAQSANGQIELDDCWIVGSTNPLSISGGGAVITSAARMATVSGEPALGDRAVFDALNYQARHANDIDNAAGIHHTLGTGSTQSALGNHSHTSFSSTVTTAGHRSAAVTKTSNYTPTATDEIIICNTSTTLTITLPAATGSGQWYEICAVGTGSVVIDASGSETIDGELTQAMIQWETIQIVDYAAGAWKVI